MPEQSSGDGPRDGLLERARRYNHKDTLSPHDYEALTRFSARLVNSGDYDAQYFILGSYSNEEKERLFKLKQLINQQEGDYNAFLLDEMPGGLHPIMKFQLVADHSDYIIGVCEHDQGGFQLELGIIVALIKYFERCHLLKRNFQGADEKYFNWMLTAGVFDMFEYVGRLWEWTPANFESKCEEFLDQL